VTNQTSSIRSSSLEAPLIVEMRGIVKRFPGVLANDHVNFELKRGEIHGLLGENGAGKSTLMNVLAGLYRQEAGTILVNGEPKIFSSLKIFCSVWMIRVSSCVCPIMTIRSQNWGNVLV
jgi:ABC-type multidrug transport system ATPase subunit